MQKRRYRFTVTPLRYAAPGGIGRPSGAAFELQRRYAAWKRNRRVRAGDRRQRALVEQAGAQELDQVACSCALRYRGFLRSGSMQAATLVRSVMRSVRSAATLEVMSSVLQLKLVLEELPTLWYPA